MAKRGNSKAVKHGAFSIMIFLPGEDREEFKALYDALAEEWDPHGPIEQDKVFNIANNMWRKRRSQRYLREAAELGDFVNRREDRDIEAIIEFLEGAEAGKPISELKLPRRWLAALKKDVPRKKFDSDEAWHKKLVEVVNELFFELVAERGQNTKELIVNRFCDEKVIAEQLALEERLDAKIDRDIVSLGKIKTMQAMGLGRRQGGPVIEHEPTKEIEAPPVQPEQAPPVRPAVAESELPKDNNET
jgi:hypothetical protein